MDTHFYLYRRILSGNSLHPHSVNTFLPGHIVILFIHVLAEPNAIKTLCRWFGSCAKSVVVRWSLTQSLHITDQLESGIRYIDMRSGYLTTEDNFFFVHGVYGHAIDDLLKEISKFLDKHPQEFVILDFNHFYSFTDALHSRFAKSINSCFQGKLYSPIGKGVKSTLKDLRKVNKQVIVSYDNATVCAKNPEFWHNAIYSPWPNTSSCSKLLESLNERFDTLEPDRFNVFQAILTPQTSTVVLHIASSLRKYLVNKCDKAVSKWLTQIYRSKRRGVNIVIYDFISMDGCAAEIIKLNHLIAYDQK